MSLLCAVNMLRVHKGLVPMSQAVRVLLLWVVCGSHRLLLINEHARVCGGP